MIKNQSQGACHAPFSDSRPKRIPRHTHPFNLLMAVIKWPLASNCATRFGAPIEHLGAPSAKVFLSDY